MNLRRAIHRAVPLCALFVFACDKSNADSAASGAAEPTPPEPPVATATAPVVPSAPPADAPRRHGRLQAGQGAMLLHAARNLTELKEPQAAALDKLFDELKEEGGPRAELKELHDELLAHVKAGKVDAAKMEPRLAAVEKSAQGRLDQEADVLNRLHAALEPAQRTAVVQTARARLSAMEGHGGGPPEGRGEDAPKVRAELLTKGLDLDAEQQKTLDAALAKSAKPAADRGAEAKAQAQALLEAFDKETFDAKKLEAFAQGGKRARALAQREVERYASIVPVLRPEQREKLGAKIESMALTGVPGGRPNFRMGGPHGGGAPARPHP